MTPDEKKLFMASVDLLISIAQSVYLVEYADKEETTNSMKLNDEDTVQFVDLMRRVMVLRLMEKMKTNEVQSDGPIPTVVAAAVDQQIEKLEEAVDKISDEEDKELKRFLERLDEARKVKHPLTKVIK